MPDIGEIKRGSDIGKNHYQFYIWSPCKLCGEPRWTTSRKGKAISERCRNCAPPLTMAGREERD